MAARTPAASAANKSRQILDDAKAEAQHQRKLAEGRRDKAIADIAKIDKELADLGVRRTKTALMVKAKSVVSTTNAVANKSKAGITQIRFNLIGKILSFLLGGVVISIILTAIPIIQPYRWWIWPITLIASFVLAIPSKKKE